jgi:TPP-dependent pyruvate/acetoin dehydrogenase alpha subunit
LVYALEVQEKLKSLYFSSKRIRQIEEYIAHRYAEQQMRCPTHLSIGQELAGAAIGIVTGKSDYAISTHRSHAHYLGKGGNLGAMVVRKVGAAQCI